LNGIEGENYAVNLDRTAATLSMSGTLRLNGLDEYAPVSKLLSELLTLTESPTLDLSKLGFLNSSGIAVLSRFVIEARTKGIDNLRIVGAQSVPWQTKSLRNLQRLMPALQLDIQ
jgi:hypothetical protein